MRNASLSLDLYGSNTPPEGFRYQPEFLTVEEESFLLQNIPNNATGCVVEIQPGVDGIRGFALD